MTTHSSNNTSATRRRWLIVGIFMSAFMLLSHFNVFSQTLTSDSVAIVIPERTATRQLPPDSEIPVTGEEGSVSPVSDRQVFIPDDETVINLDTVPTVDPYGWQMREVAFTPSPTKAVWLSALFPGLGQVYNRRYWKLPIIAGGYLGLVYATSWNNTMLSDYTTAYADLLDNDPNTKSYMDFFPPNIKEESLDKNWLQSILQSRKNYFRRNRDLCIICMVGVYLLSMVDAYVDASLSHFDISPDLSMDVAPALIQDGRSRYPSVGLQWAINF